MELYCFSGTGNTLAVARDLAAKTRGTVCSIPAAMVDGHVIPGAEAMGLLFPVQHKSIPLILKRFVEKLTFVEGAYLFAVCTYGDTPGLAMRHLARLVQARGGQLAAGFGVHMPYNYLSPTSVKDFYGSFTLREVSAEKQQALLAAARYRVVRIAAYVNARRSGALEVTADVPTRLADRLGLPETLGKSVWLKTAGVVERTGLPFMESRQLMDRAFHVDENCRGCGTCARLCPSGNIHLVDNAAGSPRPEWQHRCEQCFACLHWCPNQAIQFGKNTAGRKRYHHPGVTLADMMSQAPKT